MHTTILKLVAIILISCMLISLTGCLNWDDMLAKLYYTVTTDISDYGTYTGTAEDEYIQRFITSFFPATIEDIFSNPKFSYCVEGADNYGFEAYLEFVIEDKTEFESYVNSITQAENWQQFYFAPSYMEYEIRDGFVIAGKLENNDKNIYGIRSASIKKILYCTEEQTIIYWAMGVHDGGFADTGYFCAFFDRFRIDPAEYAKQAYGPGPELVNPE